MNCDHDPKCDGWCPRANPSPDYFDDSFSMDTALFTVEAAPKEKP